jgi:hypothetical protein
MNSVGNTESILSQERSACSRREMWSAGQGPRVGDVKCAKAKCVSGDRCGGRLWPDIPHHLEKCVSLSSLLAQKPDVTATPVPYMLGRARCDRIAGG